jgi:hypothetical protein
MHSDGLAPRVRYSKVFLMAEFGANEEIWPHECRGGV